MVILYGTRFYGKVRKCGRSFLGTQFFHIWYIPLFPIGTHLVLEQDGDGSYRGVQSAFSFKSMMAGYLRVWGPLGILIAIALSIGAIDDVADDPFALLVTSAFSGFCILALVVLTILAFAVIGRLSSEEKRQRSVYAIHTGHFVDPADMGDARHSIRETLVDTIRDRARLLASMGYRMNTDPAHVWPQLSLDPTHNDEPLITAAFTLARLDGSLASGAQKTQLEQLHGQLWQRILRANPQYLNVALQAG